MVSIQTTIYTEDRLPVTAPFFIDNMVERLHQIPSRNPTIANMADKKVEEVIFNMAV